MRKTAKDSNQNEVLKLQAELCKSLADPKRLQIVQELRDGEKSVTELAGILGLKQSNTSQHLAIFRRIGIVTSRKDGNAVYYRLSNASIAQACDMVHEIIADQLRQSIKLSSLIQT